MGPSNMGNPLNAYILDIPGQIPNLDCIVRFKRSLGQFSDSTYMEATRPLNRNIKFDEIRFRVDIKAQIPNVL